MKLTALIADDEPLARRRLAALVADVSWVQQVGEACDGAEAVELTEALRPDVLFLDIKMPELSGVEVVQRLAIAPLVIFTTAHDQHAVTAFELGAVDYLLKPFGAPRFLAAIERAEAQDDYAPCRATAPSHECADPPTSRSGCRIRRSCAYTARIS